MTSLLGYLEWGENNHAFLFQTEAELISKLVLNPTQVIHPFTILPLLGQLIALFTLFQKKPNKVLTYMSISFLGILLGFMFVIGLISLNFKIVISTLPFIVVSIMTLNHHRTIKTNNL
jgi:hypothetical protein